MPCSDPGVAVAFELVCGAVICVRWLVVNGSPDTALLATLPWAGIVIGVNTQESQWCVCFNGRG